MSNLLEKRISDMKVEIFDIRNNAALIIELTFYLSNFILIFDKNERFLVINNSLIDLY